jgi:hypothetical protein
VGGTFAGYVPIKRLILGNDLGCFDPAWRGWILRGGHRSAHLPGRMGGDAGDVLTLPLLRAQIATYQAKERAVLAMDAQPEPGEPPAIRA